MNSLKIEGLVGFAEFLEIVSINDKINKNIIVLDNKLDSYYDSNNYRNTTINVCKFGFENETCDICVKSIVDDIITYKFSVKFTNNPNNNFDMEKKIYRFEEADVYIKRENFGNVEIKENIALRFLQCLFSADFENLTKLIESDNLKDPVDYEIEFITK